MTRWATWLLVVLSTIVGIVILMGCDDDSGSSGGDTDTDSYSDTDGDTDSDADSDTDSDFYIPENCETRAVWLWASAIDTEEKLNAVLGDLEASKINTVYLDTPAINNEYGDNLGFGSPEQFINFTSQAKDKGIGVAAWIANKWREEQHGQADFTDPDEQAAQLEWVADIIDLYGENLAGIHLDYIRYDHGFCTNEGGRLDAITQLVSDIYDYLFPLGKTLSAAVVRPRPAGMKEPDDPQTPWFEDWLIEDPDDLAYLFFETGEKLREHSIGKQQDHTTWIKNEKLDGIMVMPSDAEDYAGDFPNWLQRLRLLQSYYGFVGGDTAKIHMGLTWEMNSGFNAYEIVKRIKFAREEGLNGTALFLFAHSAMSNTPLVEALTIDSVDNDFDAPYKAVVPSCLARIPTS